MQMCNDFFTCNKKIDICYSLFERGRKYIKFRMERNYSLWLFRNITQTAITELRLIQFFWLEGWARFVYVWAHI